MAITLSGGKIVSTFLPSAAPSPTAPSSLGQLYNNIGVAGPQNTTNIGGAQLRNIPSAPAPTGGSGGGGTPAGQTPGGGITPDGTYSAGYHGDQSGGNIQNLDSIYAPIFQAYDDTQKAVEQNRDQNNTDNQTTYDTQNALIPGQQKSLQDSLAGYQTQFENTANSAYDQARRSYQAAQQRAQALYGGGNGAGDAMNELAYQELQRNERGINDQRSVAQLDFGKQGQDIVNWVAQKHSDLDGWLRDAKTQVQSTFNQDLLAINNNRAATTSQKASQKVQLLSDVMAQNNALQAADNNFRRQLQLVQAQATSIGGSQMNNATFQNTVSNLYSQLAPYTSGAQQSANAAGVPSATDYFQGAPSASKNDQFANLVGA